MSTKETRVGIYTISLSYLTANYGSFFQHWALRSALARLNYSPFRICRAKESGKFGGLLGQSCYRAALIPWHVIRRHKNFLDEIRLFSYWLRREFRFSKDYRRLIGPLFEDTQQSPDIFIGGSDQMWTMEMFEYSRRAILGRLTYAASGDWKAIGKNRTLAETTQSELPAFSAISLREQRGIDVLKHLGISQPIFHALDPVLLQTKAEYLSLLPEKRLLTRPTLLTYFVNIRAAEEFSLPQWEAIADELKVNLKIVGIQGLEHFISLFRLSVPSPRDFLRYYRDADYIVTNSFHGTVFALIMNKPFVCLTQRELEGASQNTRCAELLSRLNLTARYLPYDASSDAIMEQLKSPIDYETINRKISEYRRESLAWLTQALMGLKTM